LTAFAIKVKGRRLGPDSYKKETDRYRLKERVREIEEKDKKKIRIKPRKRNQ
jgi:hypothetical protein